LHPSKRTEQWHPITTAVARHHLHEIRDPGNNRRQPDSNGKRSDLKRERAIPATAITWNEATETAPRAVTIMETRGAAVTNSRGELVPENAMVTADETIAEETTIGREKIAMAMEGSDESATSHETSRSKRRRRGRRRRKRKRRSPSRPCRTNP
jgi:hypothetical protein